MDSGFRHQANGGADDASEQLRGLLARVKNFVKTHPIEPMQHVDVTVVSQKYVEPSSVATCTVFDSPVMCDFALSRMRNEVNAAAGILQNIRYPDFQALDFAITACSQVTLASAEVLVAHVVDAPSVAIHALGVAADAASVLAPAELYDAERLAAFLQWRFCYLLTRIEKSLDQYTTDLGAQLEGLSDTTDRLYRTRVDMNIGTFELMCSGFVSELRNAQFRRDSIVMFQTLAALSVQLPL